jgi:PPP family 3-phenylpropionic acid transporter
MGRLDYGRVRASGSAAFTIGTAATGALAGLLGAWVVPLVCAGAYGLAALAARRLGPVASTGRRGGLGGFRHLLRQHPFLLTVAASACVQGSHGALYALGTLHWQRHGISEGTIGLLWSEGVVAETLFFLTARRLAERIGPAGLTALAAAVAMLRWTVTGLTTDPGPLAAVQVLHGATFGMQHLSAMLMLSRHVPPERAGTAQTLHAALGGSLPVGLASWLAGRIYDGTGAAFLVMAGVAGCGLLIAPLIGAAAARRTPPAPP